jgi:fibronectin-binding autotransporter adhesin
VVASSLPSVRVAKRKFRGVARLLMLAIVPAALATPVLATGTLTWDPLTSTTGSDGSGSWDLTSLNWASSGADVVWPNDTSTTAVFGAGGTAGVVTINAANINANGLLFNTTLSGSNYTIAAATGDILTLAGTTPTILAVTGESATISAPIAGTAGLTLNNGTANGTLTLTGANTYTGATTVLSGSLVVGPGGTLGNTSNALVIGTLGSPTAPVTTPSGAVTLNTNATIGSLSAVSYNAATPNTLAINGSVLTVGSGGLSVGFPNTVSNVATNTGLTVTGNELDVNGSVIVGLTANGTAGTTRTVSNLDLSGLTTFKMNAAAGTFNIGTNQQAGGTITLANVSNTITAASISVSVTSANAGTSTIVLGNGTNVLNASTINIGTGKGTGTIRFGTGAAATANVLIDGTTGGSTTTNITIGSETSATGSSVSSNLTLAGHSATINAGTVIVGQLNNATNATGTGTVTFDTGTFNIANLQISNDLKGGAANGTQGSIGSLTLGNSTPNTLATGVLNVTTSFVLATNTNTTAGTATGSFTINGGTANIGSDITVAGTGTRVANLTLAGGLLNMNGHAIGSAALPITNVVLGGTSLVPATLENLGNTGINGTGLLVNTTGILTLAGSNTYSGGTTINSGSTLQVTGTLPAASTVANSGALAFTGSANTAFNGSITGGGNVTQSGTGITTLSGSNSYNGPTVVTGGSLFINGSLPASAVSVTGGTLGGNGTIGSTVALSTGGTVLGGGSNTDASGVLGLGTLTVNGGKLAFNVGATGTSTITATTASFTATPTFAFNVVNTPASGSIFTLLTAGTLNDGGVLGSLAPTSVGRLIFTPSESGNTIIVTVSGSAANLIFNGAADGTTFDNETTANFLNGGTQDKFFTNDNVTFNDANGGHYNVTLVGSLAPGSLTVSNSAGNYVFGGTGSLTGVTGLTKSGTGSLTLANSGGNTYTGTTAIQNGKLILGGPAALPLAANVTFGDGTGDSGTLDLGGNNVTVSSLAVIGGSANVIGSSGSTPATLTFQTGTSTFSGAIQDVIGAGTSKVALAVASGNLTLSSTNTYSGGTIVNSGASLTVTTGASISPASALVDNGTVNLAGSTSAVAGLTGAGTLNLNGTTLAITSGGTFTGAIADGTAPGGLALSGGTFTLSGTNTFTGDTSIQNGTLRAVNSTVVGPITGGNVTISNGGSFDVGAGAASNTLNFGTKVFKISGAGVGGLGALVNSSTVSQFNSYEFITLTGDATVGGERFDIGRTGSGDVLDLGNHTLTIQMVAGGSNQPIFGIETNAGSAVPTTVLSGQIVVASGGIDLENKTLVANDGTSKITFNNGTVAQFFQTNSGNVTDPGSSITRPLVFLGNNILGPGSTAASFVDSTITLEGNVTLEPLTSGNPNLTLTGQLTLAGTIAETVSSSVTKVANNTVTLSGAGNTWTGGTFIQQGTLQAGINNALPATTLVTLGAAANSGTLDLNGFNVSVGGLATAGTGTANVIGSSSTTAPSTLTFAGTGTPSTFSGTILDAVGSGSGQTTALVVSSGSLTLASTNSFSGGTTVNGGSLFVNNTAGLGSGNVTLNGGTLGGNGTITGAVAAGSGAHTLNPGASGANSIGTLTLGSLSTNSNTTLAFDLASPSGLNDVLAVSGSLALNGGKLAVTSQSTTGASSLGYYKAISYSTLTGSTSGIVLPAVANNIEYTLDANHDLGFIDIHRGFIGDVDDNGSVTVADLNTVLANLGTTTSSWSNGNFDGAPTIDLTDLNDVLNNIGTSIASGSTVVSITGTPEPASLGILALGAAALIARRRKA